MTQTCGKGCCQRTGIPLAPGAHVTLFKCQGLTCGEGQELECLMLHVHDLLTGEKLWAKAIYVGLTRTINALDLALMGITGLKQELWDHINSASYHAQAQTQAVENEKASHATLEEMKEHVTDEGWVAFLHLVDAIANDGIRDATCLSVDKRTCASNGCAACKVAIAKCL